MAGQNGAEPRKAVKGLGSLEAQLMKALWDSTGPLSVQEVCDRLGPDHNYKTVMTVLNRLVDKELLERELEGRAYHYKPRQTREAFWESVADELVQDYVGAYGRDAVKHLFTAVAEAAPEPAPEPEPEPAPALAAPASAVPAVPASTAPDDDPLRRFAPIAALVAIAIVVQVILLIRMRR